MGCIYRKFDREGGYCSKTNLECNYGYCDEATSESPSFNSSTCKYEMFVDGKLKEV